MKSIHGTQSKIGHSLCDFCLNDENCNRMGDHEQMLYCQDCEAKAHPSCMHYSKALAIRALSYPWQCVECKTCTVCRSAQDGANILFCDGCDKAYHMKCHQPEVNEKPEGKWICATCSSMESFTNGNADHSETMEITTNGHAFDTPITPNVNTNGIGINDSFSSSNDGNLSNLAEWSSEQVSDYFKNAGFSEQAHIFIQEEIDGKSLLLLKRNDVISNLALKLGPAVKIYEHIKKLQNNGLSFIEYQNGL